MVGGYKRPLTEDSVDDLHPDQRADTVVPNFLRHWNNAEQQLRYDWLGRLAVG